MQTIHINWYGPYTYSREDGIETYDHISPFDGLSGVGLYAWTGQKKRQRNPACLQYIGITIEAYKWRFEKEHPHNEITRDKYVWLGKIQHHEFTGDNRQEATPILEAVEHILVSYCQPPLNEKKLNRPQFSCTVISRFCKKDIEPYKRIPSIISVIPELVIWDGKEIRDNRTRIRGYTPE